jgi:hypothetical protein
MTERFGDPEPRAENILVWHDKGKSGELTGLECYLSDKDLVKTVRIVPSFPRRMSRDELLRTIARYNGGHIEKPEDRQRHTVSGGAGAIAFQNDYWAYVQQDPVGCVYGIKIWVEPLTQGDPEGVEGAAPQAPPGTGMDEKLRAGPTDTAIVEGPAPVARPEPALGESAETTESSDPVDAEDETDAAPESLDSGQAPVPGVSPDPDEPAKG